MAEIYLARPASGSVGVRPGPFVVKRLFAHQSHDAEFVRMFKNEARLAALLKHPNVVDIFDEGEADGSFYLAMEFINGEDLRAIAQQSDALGRRPPIWVIGRMILDVLAGLHYAHALTDAEGKPLGVVHRDISPQNILVTYDGVAKIIDFGIAKATMAAESEQTQAGMVKGKYAYMSPEQARSARLDGRSDVFSVGILLWELLTWRRLFKRGTDLATMVAVAEEPVPPLAEYAPDCPAELEQVVQKALAKETEQRYRSARDFADELADVLTRQGWQYNQKAVGAYMGEIFRERIAQRDAELRSVINAARRDSLRQAVPSVKLGAKEAISKKQPAVTMPLQVINLAAGPGGKPNVPANLRTTMPFGLAGQKTGAKTAASAAGSLSQQFAQPKERSSEVKALAKNAAGSADTSGRFPARGTTPQVGVAKVEVTPQDAADTVPQRKVTPLSGLAPVSAAAAPKRSSSDTIKTTSGKVDASLATVPMAAVNRPVSRDRLPTSSRRQIGAAVGLGIALGVLAVIVFQLFFR